MRPHKKIGAAFIIIAFTCTQWLAAEPLIYEPFDYPAGSLNGASGSSEVGFTGAWSADELTLVAENSLKHGTLPTKGGRIGNLSGKQNRPGGTRKVKISALGSSGLLKDDSTLWFSVIVGFSDQAVITNARLGLCLGSSGFNNGKYSYCLSEPGATGIGLTLGKFEQYRGQIFATQFRDGSIGGLEGFKDNVFGTIDQKATLPQEGEHALVVGSIKWGASSDTIDLYLADENLQIGKAHSTLTVNVDQSRFDTISFKRSDMVTMDEIRFGATYADVIAVSDAKPPRPVDGPAIANKETDNKATPKPITPKVNVPQLAKGETILISDNFERNNDNWTLSGKSERYKHNGSGDNHAKTGNCAIKLSNPVSNKPEDSSCLTLSRPLVLKSRGARELYITFDYIWHQSGKADPKFVVEYSPDGGKSWSKLNAVFSSENPNGSSFLSINSNITDNALIRFRRLINEPLILDYDAYLDNIVISAKR